MVRIKNIKVKQLFHDNNNNVIISNHQTIDDADKKLIQISSETPKGGIYNDVLVTIKFTDGTFITTHHRISFGNIGCDILEKLDRYFTSIKNAKPGEPGYEKKRMANEMSRKLNESLSSLSVYEKHNNEKSSNKPPLNESTENIDKMNITEISEWLEEISEQANNNEKTTKIDVAKRVSNEIRNRFESTDFTITTNNKEVNISWYFGPTVEEVKHCLEEAIFEESGEIENSDYTVIEDSDNPDITDNVILLLSEDLENGLINFNRYVTGDYLLDQAKKLAHQKGLQPDKINEQNLSIIITDDGETLLTATNNLIENQSFEHPDQYDYGKQL